MARLAITRQDDARHLRISLPLTRAPCDDLLDLFTTFRLMIITPRPQSAPNPQRHLEAVATPSDTAIFCSLTPVRLSSALRGSVASGLLPPYLLISGVCAALATRDKQITGRIAPSQGCVLAGSRSCRLARTRTHVNAGGGSESVVALSTIGACIRVRIRECRHRFVSPTHRKLQYGRTIETEEGVVYSATRKRGLPSHDLSLLWT